MRWAAYRILLLIAGSLFASACIAASARAACPPLPATLTNGTLADANQVMSNFNSLVSCFNNNAMHANGDNAVLPVARVSLGATPPINAVKDLGFVGGGTINNAALLPFLFGRTDGATVYFPAGIYNIGCPSSITTAASGISLVGDGEQRSVLQLSAGCTFGSDLFHWDGVSGFSISNIGLDCNSANILGFKMLGLFAYSSGMSDATISNTKISNCTPPGNSTPTAGLILMAAAGGFTMSNVNITNNDLSFKTPMTTSVYNCVVLTTNALTSAGFISRSAITGNRCANAGMQIDGDHLAILNNDMSGRGFFFPGLQSGAGYATNSNHVVQGNNFHDGTTLHDLDSSAAVGMEFGGTRSLISGNTCYKMGGTCIAHFGADNLIVGNVSADGGQVTTPVVGNENCGFTTDFQSGKNFGHDTQWVNNVTYDDQGSPTQLNGYCDVVISSGGTTSNISFQGNHFSAYTGGQEFLLTHPWPSDWMTLGNVNTSAASLAAIEFTNIDPSFGHYRITCSGVYPNTSTSQILLRVGEGATPTWQSAASYVSVGYNIPVSSGTLATFNFASGTSFSISGGLGGLSPTPGAILTVDFDALGLTGGHHTAGWHYDFVDSTSTGQNTLAGSGNWGGDTNAVTGLQLFSSSGNILGNCALDGKL
jgi:hypothetical protein